MLISFPKLLFTTISLSGVVAGGYGISYIYGSNGRIVDKTRTIYDSSDHTKVASYYSTGDSSATPSEKRRVEKKFYAEGIYRQKDGTLSCKNLVLSGNSVNFEEVGETECKQKSEQLKIQDSEDQLSKVWIKAKDDEAVRKALNSYSISFDIKAGESQKEDREWICNRNEENQEVSEKTIVISCNKKPQIEVSEDISN
ncbi:hypothetical protein [Mycoplasma suis]|uniref:Uncharacterized protein n=1 Tax=Mycoplasma suis (strain Illinois) TaxID=768700 RepID=F0QQD4_MYCSL|nr:hypothetical protein [Mycoplasma suis]ADX97704.1 hypothetical protein MSU_0160 [Mycoplasma suis str. Illinois]